MNIFKKFIIYIKEKVFNIKPEFNIEIKECWFSKDWLYIRYTDGYNWYYIVEEAIDTHENKWNKYKVCTRCIKITNIESFMKHNDLSTFEKCEQFCKNVYNWVNEHNERAYSEYIKKVNPGRTFVKNFNSK